MNFDAFWQTHRRFILGYAGGVLGFFLVLFVLTSGARDKRDEAERSLRRTQRELQGDRYAASQVGELEQRLAELEQRNATLGSRALPPVRERFALPPTVPPSQHYIETTGALRQELVAWALRNDCEVDDSLGLPAVSPTQAQQIARVLRGLDVVERVVRLAVENGASAVEKISIGSRTSRGRGRNQPVLDVTQVTLEVVFERQTATPFLRALLEQEEAGTPTGLVALEVEPLKPRRLERRVMLEFGAGVLPEPVDEEGRP